jgi:protein JSN1
MEDVRNRLGGHISQTGGGAPVRVGFGKIDSVPLGPSDSMSNGANAGTASYAGPGGESQTSPTRALWVGSIPSTTTPSKLLSLFVPFGPIESVRVLTHKNCGFVSCSALFLASCWLGR